MYATLCQSSTTIFVLLLIILHIQLLDFFSSALFFLLTSLSALDPIAGILSIYPLLLRRVGLSRLPELFIFSLLHTKITTQLQSLITTMVQAESSTKAARNGLQPVTAGAPQDYELPW